MVHQLAQQGQLAAVVMEMAEQGRDTRGLPPQASEALVQERLRWANDAWPWRQYGPVVMAAVRLGERLLGLRGA